MTRLLALVAVGLTAATANAAADSFVVVSDQSAPAPVPNAQGSIAIPARPSRAEQPARFSDLYSIWRHAGTSYGIPWEVLAAINKIESDFGRNMGPSSAGAIGWMQFMPDTWARWGTDGNADGIADPWNATDAVFAAARYLSAAGGTRDLSRAVFAYNHAQWYVDQVLSLAQRYGMGGIFQTGVLDQLQQDVGTNSDEVVQAQSALTAALAVQRRLERRQRDTERRVGRTMLLSRRLALEKRSALLAFRVALARKHASDLQASLERAARQLDAAQANAGLGSWLDANAAVTASADGSSHVFPVGGGPGMVSVSHWHHDYPAADIVAPEGSPVYALADGTVVAAWHSPSGRCGIGFTFNAADGDTWTYCHLAYLAPAVAPAAALTAGARIGLVGHTGHASGPHLHLQLQPATAWPQRQPWFESFAGTAFRWEDGETAPTGETGTPSPRFEVLRPSAGTWIAESIERH
jgi:murein DD-endopeptidase MepM/ murein hydrolase activator NlpD